MSRRSHRRRGLRPGRRPPDRFSRGPRQPPGSAYTGGAFGPLFRLLLPELHGRKERLFYNRLSGSMLLGSAAAVAILGGALGGPVGAVVGLAAGLAVGGVLVRKGGFYRG